MSVATGREAIPTVLAVHHMPPPAMPEMLEVVHPGAADDAIEGVDVVRGRRSPRPPSASFPPTPTCSAPRRTAAA